MINKQNLWFVTLFSLILVLSVYYITMPSELLLTNNGDYQNKVKETEKANSTVTVSESDILVAMRLSSDEERMTARETLQEVLTSTEASTEDKNKAYDNLKLLNEVKGKEESIEVKIKKTFSLDSFVKIDKDQIKVVVVAKEHNNQLANNMMRSIQEEFKEKVYITIKFEK